MVLARRETTSPSNCYKWNDQQAAMWVRVKEEGKQCWGTYWRMRGPAVLDFLRSTHVGMTAPPAEENWDSEGSEGDTEGEGEERAYEAEGDGVEEQVEQWRSKRSGGASGVVEEQAGSPWCEIGFVPFIISLVCLWCVISFRERRGGELLPSPPLLGAPASGRDGQTGLG